MKNEQNGFSLVVVLGVVVLLAIAGSLIFVLSSNEEDEVVTNASTESVETQENVATNEAIEANEQNLAESETLEQITLDVKANYKGTGSATRDVVDGVFTHTVTLDIGDPAEGKFYEGWLVKKTPSLTFVSTGEMEKVDEKYILSFTSDKDFSEYIDVVITEETLSNGLDNIPEDHVFEGTF